MTSEIKFERTSDPKKVIVEGHLVEDNGYGLLIYLPTPAHLKYYRVHQMRDEAQPCLCKCPSMGAAGMTVVPYFKDANGNWTSRAENGQNSFQKDSLEYVAFELAVKLKEGNFNF